MATNRLESFSDGVIAVAITLLVLGIVVPPPTTASDHSLIWRLGQQWPSYAAYVVSFITIGIIWINHHVMINRLARADHAILMLNLILLMSIAVLPFATNLMASYLRESSGEHVAAAIYGGALLVMAVAFYSLNTLILMRKPQMLSSEIPLEERRRILRRTRTGLAPYALATGLAFVSPFITLAITGALAAFYALPIASGLDHPG